MSTLGQERFIHTMTHLFDPEEAKLKPIVGSKITNFLHFFEPVFFRIKDLSNGITVSNAQSMAITMLQSDAEANLPLLRKIFLTFSFNRLQENAHLKLVFATAALSSFSVLQLTASNPKLTDDGSEENNLANGAFHQLITHYPDYFLFSDDFDHLRFIVCGSKVLFKFTKSHEFSVCDLWSSLKALPLLRTSSLKTFRSNLRAFIIKPWYYYVTQPADYHQLVHYSKSIHKFAESKAQELEEHAENGDAPAQLITSLNNWKYLSETTLAISKLADYVEQD